MNFYKGKRMKKKKLFIEPGCIGCGLCAALAPEIFEVHNVSKVKENADIDAHEEEIKKAVRSCPVQVIKFEE